MNYRRKLAFKSVFNNQFINTPSNDFGLLLKIMNV